jgi:hypothetical protein
MRGNAYPIVTLVDNLLGLVPVTILHGALEVGSMVAVKVLEDAVLVLETTLVLDWGSVLDGSETTGGRGQSRGGGGGRRHDTVRCRRCDC